VTALRTFAFGRLDTGVWGVAWIPADPQQAFVAIGSPTGSAVLPATLDGDSPDHAWSLRADGIGLQIAPAGDPVRAAGPGTNGEAGGFDQLCLIDGSVLIGAAEHCAHSYGSRTARPRLADLDRFASVREVAAWFGPDQGLTLLALRPPRSRGHDHDVLSASLFDPEGAVAVAEPRLSTTYAAGGRIARAGLELWLGGDDEEEQQYPRRVAGEALGPAASGTAGGLAVQAELLRWHSRGLDGVGVYLLATRG
jgi:hypothetical protein